MGQYLRNVATLQLDREACVGCGMCATVCPHAVFLLDRGKAEVRGRDDCMECGACARNCPVDAIAVVPGVGCATGMIYAALGRQDACCCADQRNG